MWVTGKVRVETQIVFINLWHIVNQHYQKLPKAILWLVAKT